MNKNFLRSASVLTNDYNGNGMLYYNSKIRFADVSDGTSNTLMLAECALVDTSRVAAIWGGCWQAYNVSSQFWAADRVNFRINGPGVQAPSSRHVGGCHFGLVDGSIRFLSENIDGITFEGLVTRGSGEIVGQF